MRCSGSSQSEVPVKPVWPNDASPISSPHALFVAQVSQPRARVPAARLVKRRTVLSEKTRTPR
jgi:hypothetical protein